MCMHFSSKEISFTHCIALLLKFVPIILKMEIQRTFEILRITIASISSTLEIVIRYLQVCQMIPIWRQLQSLDLFILPGHNITY